MNDFLQQLTVAEQETQRAVQLSCGIVGEEATMRYHLVAAAQQLLVAAKSDLHPSYVTEKAGTALMLLDGAFRYMGGKTLPLAIDIEVEGGCVQDIKTTTKGYEVRCNVQVIDLDDDDQDADPLELWSRDKLTQAEVLREWTMISEQDDTFFDMEFGGSCIDIFEVEDSWHLIGFVNAPESQYLVLETSQQGFLDVFEWTQQEYEDFVKTWEEEHPDDDDL